MADADKYVESWRTPLSLSLLIFIYPSKLKNIIFKFYVFLI